MEIKNKKEISTNLYQGKLIVTMIIGYNNIFNNVKMLTTNLGINIRDDNNNDMYDRLVLDEQYDVLFENYFNNSSAAVIDASTSFLKDEPISNYITDERYNELDRDFTLQYFLNKDFKKVLLPTIYNYIKQFMVNNIMGEWLKDKKPDMAQLYLATAEDYLNKITISINSGQLVTSTRYRWF